MHKIRTLFLSWDIEKSSLIALRCAAMRQVAASHVHHRANLLMMLMLRDKNSVLILCIIVVAVFFFFGQGSRSDQLSSAILTDSKITKANVFALRSFEMTYCVLHLRPYLAALSTNPPECSHTVWSRNGREGCSGGCMTSLCKWSIVKILRRSIAQRK